MTLGPTDAADPAYAPAAPPELPADAARQAVAPIRGVIYQLWWSIDAWLRLKTPDEVIYLEGAEDLDKASPAEAIAQQVKGEVDGISLNNKRALKALENFWRLRCNEVARTVEFHYISTAPAVVERDAVFGGISGVAAWGVARDSVDMAARMQQYLTPKFSEDSALRAFLEAADAVTVQARFIRPVYWFLGQPGLEMLRQRVEDRVAHRLSDAGTGLVYCAKVCDRLYSFVSEMVVRPTSGSRLLTTGELLRQIDVATTVHLPVPAMQLGQFVQALQALEATGEFDPSRRLLNMMKLEMPPAPRPLLNREALVQTVRERVEAHAAVLLTGSVHKGKTTVAQLVGHALCPDAWWFPLGTRTVAETDKLLTALSAAIEGAGAPSLVVVDNIDMSPSAFSAFGATLSVVMHRASRAKRSLIFTARGESSGSDQLALKAGFEVIEVPTMSSDEVALHCQAYGCSYELSLVWGALICGLTQGHPKLVQVRIAELGAGGWPAPTSTDMVIASPAVKTARNTARSMLSSTVLPQVASFVYTAGQATYPLSRGMLLSLAQEFEGIPNGGDVIDALEGKWFEQSKPDRLSVTPLLKGVAEQVWTETQTGEAHTRLFDAIASVRQLDVADASSLLFHAFMAKDAWRLLKAARIIETIDEVAVAKALFQQLTWLPFIGLGPGERFFAPHPMVSVLLRQVQFTVAHESGSPEVARVLAQWTEEVVCIEDEQLREALEVARCSRVAINRNPLVAMRHKLGAIYSLNRRRGELAEFTERNAKRFMLDPRQAALEIPEEATTSQFFLSMQASSLRGLADFAGLLDWLEFDIDDAAREQFDAVLDWPSVNSSGAFVHGAWSAGCTERTDWAPTLELLGRAKDLALHKRLRRFGREVAKAMAIVQVEHVNDPVGAMKTLDEAVTAFGESVAIEEQRANVLFQTDDHGGALYQWEVLEKLPQAREQLDAFSYRRAAISACHLMRWEKAGELFLAGAGVPAMRTSPLTRFGLVVDASRAIAMGRGCRSAARMLADLFVDASEAVSEDGHEGWQAVLGVASATCKTIEDLAFGKAADSRPMAYGKASEPGLTFGPATHGQKLRALLMTVSAIELAAMLGDVPEAAEPSLRTAMQSPILAARYVGAQAMLAYEFSRGSSEEVVPALACYERAMNTMHCVPGSMRSHEPQGDVSTPASSQISNAGLAAVFAACALCSDDPAVSLSTLRSGAVAVWGEDAPVVASLERMSEALSMSLDEARSALARSQGATVERTFGAATVLLRNERTPEGVLRLQALLASVTVCSEEGTQLQRTFAHAIARRWAPMWEQLSRSAFLFQSPRLTIPMLKQAVADVNTGRAAIKAMLTAAAVALGVDPANFHPRIA